MGPLLAVIGLTLIIEGHLLRGVALVCMAFLI